MKRAGLVLLMLLLSMPAMAVEIKVGDAVVTVKGSIRYDVGYQISDLGDEALWAKDEKTDFFMAQPGNSRLGVGVDYDKISAYVEAGVADSDMYTRHAYLTYDMGDDGTLLIGQTWSILAMDSPFQRLNGDDAIEGHGDLYAGRNPMIAYSRALSDQVGLTLAIEDNKLVTPDALVGSYQAKEIMPAILGSIDLKVADNIYLNPSFFFERFEWEANALTGGIDLNDDGTDDVTIPLKDQELTGWALALNGKVEADKLTLSFEGWGGQNLAAFAEYFDIRPAKKNNLFGSPIADLSGATLYALTGNQNALYTLTKIEDCMSYGGWAQVSVPVEKATIYAGGGFQESQIDAGSFYVEDRLRTWAAFINFTYPIYKGFYMQPEIAYFDYGDDLLIDNNLAGVFNTFPYYFGQNDLGDDLFVGIHFQYDF